MEEYKRHVNIDVQRRLVTLTVISLYLAYIGKISMAKFITQHKHGRDKYNREVYAHGKSPLFFFYKMLIT